MPSFFDQAANAPRDGSAASTDGRFSGDEEHGGSGQRGRLFVGLWQLARGSSHPHTPIPTWAPVPSLALPVSALLFAIFVAAGIGTAKGVGTTRGATAGATASGSAVTIEDSQAAAPAPPGS